MATYYCRSSGGSDGNAGTSFGAAFATVQKLADTVTSADVGLVCADGTHSPTTTIDFDTNTGTPTARPVIRGAAADGTDDGTVATISGASLGAGADLIDTTVDHLEFRNLRFTAGKTFNIDSGSIGLILRNCRVDNAASHGINQKTIAERVSLFECELDNNVGMGYSGGFNSRGCVSLRNCRVHHNTGGGIRLVPGMSVSGSMIYKNGSHGIMFAGDTGATASNVVQISRCVLFANTGNGFDIQAIATANTFLIAVSDTIFRSNTGYGFDANGSDVDYLWFDNCCSHNNGTAAIDVNSGVLPGTGNLTVDPQFTSETNNSEDFTPMNTALKITRSLGAGSDYRWIGAIQPNATAGGAIGAGNLSGGFQ